VRGLLLGLVAVVLGGALPMRAATGQRLTGDAPSSVDATQPNRGTPGMDHNAARANDKAGNTRVEASPLDTILLRDSKGNLVPVVGIPFEEFEQLLRVKKGLAPGSPPAYTVDSVSLAGKASAQSAEFQLTATIRVREDGWIRVPLNLGGAVIRSTKGRVSTFWHMTRPLTAMCAGSTAMMLVRTSSAFLCHHQSLPPARNYDWRFRCCTRRNHHCGWLSSRRPWMRPWPRAKALPPRAR
jgi:hypothetical protein